MAETVRGINVVISGDTTKLGKALEDVNKKGKEIQGELRQIERLLKFDPSNTTLLAQKQQLLAKQIENTSEKLNRLKSVQQQVNEQFQRGEISEGQYRAFQREIEKTEGQLRTLQSRLEETNGAITRHTTTWGRLQESLNRVGQNLRDVGQRMQSVGQSMVTSMGAAATAIGGALGFAVKKSMDFEAQIDRVGAISGANAEELKALEQAALELGASTSKSATEVAQAQEIMATMGYKTNEIIAALPGIISAAEASGEDMALVADTVSAALNSFSLKASEASRVADILAQAANDSAASVQDMQYTFKYAAPIAKSLGISLEELAAATEIMSNAGIKGEQAGTTLRGGLIQLLKPSEETSKMMEKLGIKIEDSKGNFVGLANLIRNISEALEGQTRSQKLANLAAMVGTEAASGFLTLIEAGPQKIEQYTKSLENSAGASQEAAKKMKDNLKGSLEELQGAFETAQITIGNALAPAIEKVAGYIQKLVDWFNNLSPSAQKTIATIAAVAAVLAGIGTAIGVLLGIVGAAASGIGALAAVFGTISAPVLAVVAVIAALVAAIALAWNKSEAFRNAVTAAFNTISNVVLSAIGAVRDFIVQKFSEIQAFWQQNGQQIAQATTNVFNAIKSIISFVMPFVLGIIKSAWSNIQGVISGAVKIILGVIKTFSALLTGDWKGVWEGVKKILSGAVQFIWNAIQLGFMGKIFGVLHGFVGKAIGKVGELASKFKGKFGEILSSAQSRFNAIKNAIMSPIQKAVDFVKGQVGRIKSFFSGLKISLPKIKLPHFKLSGSFSLNPPRVPKISVDWYKIGGVFERPVIFGNAGFGDVSEAIVPFEGRHARRIAGLIAREMDGYSRPQQTAVIQIEAPVILDGREIARGTHRFVTELQEKEIIRQLRFRGSFA
ncbi:phage tail tape measure protein [Geobacillus kaustophilus]|uniref:phage tail tape measure protein n=1 Tax=Geobacillus kaustophilus TaxID=1462 RepID=UPI000696AA9B|nr:phage tail tape measure protein [Geobacillus kaustophilus]